MEFDGLGVEFGYTYNASGAVVPDGTPPPENPDPIRLYQPAARPGHPLPHAWLENPETPENLEDGDGRRLPLAQLVRPGRFLLVAGEDGHAWCEAAAKIAARADLPLDAVRIGHLDGDYRDVRSTWTRWRGHSPAGAVLVRPDRFVAWRSPGGTDTPGATLARALETLLHRTPDHPGR
nr:hypothetical protein [Streptomyces specialis]